MKPDLGISSFLRSWLRLLLVTVLALGLCLPLSAAGAGAEPDKKTSTISQKAATAASRTASPAKKAPAKAKAGAAKSAPAKNAVKTNPAKGKAQSAAKKKSGTKSGYNVKAAITMDLTSKRVLYQQNADTRIAPASLTKVLNMFVVLDQVKARKVSLNDRVTVSARAAGTGGSRMGLTAGEKVRLRDLLKGMAIASGNDAAVAVAQHVAGNEAAFVKMMNAKARTLGMKNSAFMNVHGLPAKGQLTTARDMLTLTRNYLTAHPDAVAQFHTPAKLEHHGFKTNTNPLLGMDGVDGLKTGFVNASGYNLITTARRGNTRLVNVLLGAQSKSVRLQEATRMVETGFATAGKMAEADKAKKAAQRQAAAKLPDKARSHAAGASPATGG